MVSIFALKRAISEAIKNITLQVSVAHKEQFPSDLQFRQLAIGGELIVPEGEEWDHCEPKELSTPKFYWTYFDQDDVPLGSDPQTAYEIEVDNNSSFVAPKFNYLVNLAATSYVLDLSQDDDSDWLEEENITVVQVDFECQYRNSALDR